MQCKRCRSFNVVYVGKDTYSCYDCGHTMKAPMPKLSPYERTKAQVYATGNKWAIENFNATH